MSEKKSLGEFLKWDIGLVEEELERLKKLRVNVDGKITRLEKLLERTKSNLRIHRELNKNETSA